MKNTIKILGTVMCAFVLDCAWGMNDVQFQFDNFMQRQGNSRQKHEDAINEQINSMSDTDALSWINEQLAEVKEKLKTAPESEQASPEFEDLLAKSAALSKIKRQIEKKIKRQQVK